MRTELVCVGSELLLDKLNTNIIYISEKLNSIGINIDCATTVPDKMDIMVNTISEIISRADIIFITGGLGPTFDDLTREVISKILKRKLIFSKELLQQIVKYFIERNKEMPKENEKQAYIIEGAQPIINTVGTAPGQIIEVKKLKITNSQTTTKIQKEKLSKENFKNHLIFLLPGPIKEIQPMMESTILPLLKKKYGNRLIKTKTLHIYGLPESKVDELIRPVIETEYKLEKENVSFSILAHQSIIDIKIIVSGENELIIDELINNIRNELYSILGNNIYGEDEQSLEQVISELFMKTKKTLSIAESCTGGLVANRITNIPGASVYFKQGIIAYSNEAKINILGVLPETINKYGAVSKETALEMAQGIKKLTKSDFGLSITGIAGPTGATITKPVGLVWFGLVTDNETITQEMNFSGSRIDIKTAASNYALFLLYKVIKNF